MPASMGLMKCRWRHPPLNNGSNSQGVEQETLACGTGSVAAAIISHVNSSRSIPINVRTKSGELLKVDFDVSKNDEFGNVTLTGSAKIVFEGKIKI